MAGRIPPPIPTAKGVRSAADPILCEQIYRSVQIPELKLPQHAARSKPDQISYESIVLREYESVRGFLRSMREFGAVRISDHGILTEDLRLALANGDRIFTVDCCTSYGDHEQIDWGGDRISEEAAAAIGEQNYQIFRRKMDNAAMKLEGIAKELCKVIAESGSNHNQETIKFGESKFSIYRYHRANINDRNSSLISEESKDSGPYALILHLFLESSEFCIESGLGLLSFETEPESLVVTTGKELEEWSNGEIKSGQDDSLLFFKAKGEGPKRVMEALNLYSKASGQLINFEKSALTLNPGASTESENKIKSIFGVQLVQSHSIYLGLPTFVMKKRRLQFGYLVDKASRKLGGWMNKSFSLGGKETLIKSVIQSIPTYTMSCFRVPMAVCADIERRCARFWWGDKENERKMHWATWLDMCKPKSKGGMGFKNLSEFNRALLAKQVWRLIRHPDSLVARMFKAKYYAQCDVMQAKLSTNASFIWRSLLWGRELLEEGLRWKVGDGKNISLFQDAWLPSKSHGRIVSLDRGLKDVLVEEFIDNNNQWNIEKLKEVIVLQEVEEVLRIEIPREPKADVRYWKHDPKGEYTVKSGYLAATNYFSPPSFRSEDGFARWWKYVWSFDLPPRVRIFAWKCFKNFIPTEMNLHNHHVPLFGRCSWCRKGWGSTSHALIYCEKIRDRWKGTKFWKSLSRLEGFDISDVGGVMQENTTREDFQVWIMGLWLNWADLCAAKHGGSFKEGRNILADCEKYISCYNMAREQAADQLNPLPIVGSAKWVKPRKGRFRLDVDYAVDESRGIAGIGAVARNHEGRTMFALAKPVAVSSSVTQGELRAIMHGICQTVEEGLSPVEVYSDSLLAVHIINNEQEVNGVLIEDLNDFFMSVKELNIYSFKHMRRDANLVAHRIACLAKSLVSSVVWHDDDCPHWILDMVRHDLC